MAPNGQPAGTNSIRLTLGDCVLEENWTGSQGGYGRSLNAWDSQRKVWHQTWVDSQGTVLLLDGGPEGTDMVLRGETMGQGGAKVLDRITWQPRSHDEVRQLWEVSNDGGRTWTVAFDGRYLRRK